MNTSDQTYMQYIREGSERERDWALYQFYNDDSISSYCIAQVKQAGYGEEIFEDLFQDSIVLFDRNIRNNSFKENCSLKTYLIALFKWSLLGYKRKKKDKYDAIEDHHIQEWSESPEAMMIALERIEIVNDGLDQLDDRCKELLTYVKLGHLVKDLVELMGFSSSDMAKKQAYRCRNRLRDYFLSRPDLMNVLNIEKK